jgi:chromosome segregation ATPase
VYADCNFELPLDQRATDFIQKTWQVLAKVNMEKQKVDSITERAEEKKQPTEKNDQNDQNQLRQLRAKYEALNGSIGALKARLAELEGGW